MCIRDRQCKLTRHIRDKYIKRRRSDLVHISSIDVKQPLTDEGKVLVPERRKRLEMSDATWPLIHLDSTEIQLHTTRLSFTSITLPSLFVPGHHKLKTFEAAALTDCCFRRCVQIFLLTSVLWHCWLAVRKSIRPVKISVMVIWRGYLSAARCKGFALQSSWCYCHHIISCLIKIQIGLTFLVPAYPGCPGIEAITWVSVCPRALQCLNSVF